MIEINQCPHCRGNDGKGVWNMDLYANKKIKITRDTLTGEELLELKDKQSYNSNRARNDKKGVLLSGGFSSKKFYSTSSKNGSDNKYLGYITPLRAIKKNEKVINKLKGKKPFSAMDIETIGINGKEIPISISIKTRSINPGKGKIFLIDQFKL